MSNYHARIMNIPAYPDAPLEYREGHRDARHAAASVALEAETDIVWLRAEVKRLTEALREEQGESLRQAEIARDALTETERLRDVVQIQAGHVLDLERALAAGGKGES